MTEGDKKEIAAIHGMLADAWEKLAQAEDALNEMQGLYDEWKEVSNMVGDLQDIMDELAPLMQGATE